MEWALALVALALLGVAAVSRRLGGTPITPAMLFVAFGLLVGSEALEGIDLSSTGAAVRTLAEATLALVLFCDASRIDLRQLRRAVGVPVRLLGFGLPLTILLGAVAAAVLFGELSVEEAVILAIVLAPTDAALGQAVVTEPRVPQRIRQGLNVESGLNDGICVPLLFAAVAAADVESEISGGRSPGTLLLEEIGYGVLGGVVAGLLIAAIVTQAGRRDLIAPGVEAGDSGCRRRACLWHRQRAGWVGLHRRLRGRHRVPSCPPARPRRAQPAQRRGGLGPQRQATGKVDGLTTTVDTASDKVDPLLETLDRAVPVVEEASEIMREALPVLERVAALAGPLEGTVGRLGRLSDRLPGGGA